MAVKNENDLLKMVIIVGLLKITSGSPEAELHEIYNILSTFKNTQKI